MYDTGALIVRMPIRIAAAILWRSFFIQGAWNFKGMQNIGFTNAILPGLKYVAPGNLPKIIKRYLTFFNTQPYMAPTIMGVYLNLHEQGKEEMVEKINTSLSGSLAAIGDTFFWATLKPLMALLFLLTMIMNQLWGLFFALILYNSVHLWAMIWGFFQGYRHGPTGALAMGHLLSVDISKLIALMIPFLSGVILCLVSDWSGTGHGLLMGLLLFIACIPPLKLQINPAWIVYGVFTLTVIWTMV
jgi:mannose/fructose/N-acetylgalactosamine-specific phosphotransferase system component IID